jgi:hypothetical protein
MYQAKRTGEKRICFFEEAAGMSVPEPSFARATT